MTLLRSNSRWIIHFVAVIALGLCAESPLVVHAADGYRVVHAYPHDQHAFTQGLVYVDGHLYESTGIKAQSSLREEDLDTGRILRMQLVPDQVQHRCHLWWLAEEAAPLASSIDDQA